MSYLNLMMFIITLFMISYMYNHLFLTLISFEFMMLSVLLMLMIKFLNLNMIYLFYYLVFVVCEGVLGLTLLILLIRSKGNDNLLMFNLMEL
nr:NADH dehydrogenase subunit 4L [Merostenus sp.]